MVTLNWETERTDGVTLVRLYVTAEHRRRVRVENHLDGPVWPPRREGQPAAGWDGDAFEGVVTPDDRLVAGYATPAPPADPPAEVVSEEPADPDAPPGPAGGSVDPLGGGGRPAATDGGGSAKGGTNTANGWAGTGFQPPNGDGSSGESPDDEPTPAEVVRSLGDPVVPREAVPVPDAPEEADDEAETASRVDAAGDVDSQDGEEKAGPDPADETGTVDPPGSPGGVTPPGTDAELVVPGAVRAWLRDVDQRLCAVERRRDAGTVDPDPTLQVAVAGDRRALSRVADRVETLAGRAAAVERRAGSDGRR
ncbi:MAG: hypothetical protein V5A28_03815 [Haloarculaceae archaeon]